MDDSPSPKLTKNKARGSQASEEDDPNFYSLQLSADKIETLNAEKALLMN